MRIELWAVDRPVPYLRNARKISELAIEKVALSIKEFGWQQPIVVDVEGVVIAGHTRLLAAKKLGLRDVPIHVASELSGEQIKAYRLMDNRSHEEAEWDLDLLGSELFDLKENGLNLAFSGFDEDELSELLSPKTSGLTDKDAAPETPLEPVTKPGDLYVLGSHRLLCGDSTVEENVARLLGGIKPLLMVTDPPYGVDYDPTWRQKTGHIGKVANDNRSDWRAAWALFAGDIAYVWHASLHSREVVESLEAYRFKLRAQIIWAKPNLQMSRGHYHWQHEPCWYTVRDNATARWNGDRKQTTLWAIASKLDDTETGHGTQKPVECMRRPILNNSKPGDAVYDPFCGSGTTVIACESEGRVCYALELDPAYCDVTVRRWQNFTGKQAILAESGRTFDELCAERAGVVA